MTMQNQTFAAAIPTATLSSASYAPSDLTSLRVVTSNDHPSYGNYYQTTLSDAPPGLVYTVQLALGFGHYIRDFPTGSEEVSYTLRLAADGCR